MGNTVENKQNGFDAEELVLHLSDIHFGERVESEHNAYNTAIAKARLNYFFDKALKISRDIYGRLIPIKKLHIFLTGDNVHNETMRGSAKMYAELNILEQINGVADILAENITNFLLRWKAIKEVHIYGVSGNHGRIGIPGENDPAANYDRQVYDRLQLATRLKQAELSGLQDRKIHFHFPRRGETVTARIAKWWFVAHHGDGVKNQLGIPYYGLARLRDRLYKAFKGKMDVLLIGHFHRGYSEVDGTVKVIMAPSLVGWNEFIGKLGSGHYAGANLYMVHPNWGVTVERSIQVGHIKEG